MPAKRRVEVPARSLMIVADVSALGNIVQVTALDEKLISEDFDPRPVDFRHESPYAFERILPSGQYVFS